MARCSVVFCPRLTPCARSPSSSGSIFLWASSAGAYRLLQEANLRDVIFRLCVPRMALQRALCKVRRAFKDSMMLAASSGDSPSSAAVLLSSRRSARLRIWMPSAAMATAERPCAEPPRPFWLPSTMASLGCPPRRSSPRRWPTPSTAKLGALPARSTAFFSQAHRIAPGKLATVRTCRPLTGGKCSWLVGEEGRGIDREVRNSRVRGCLGHTIPFHPKFGADLQFFISLYHFFFAGLQAVMKYGGASEDDRTMLDVLLPVARLLQQGRSNP